MAKPKKAEIRKAAKRLFKREKKSKQEVFEILKKRFKNTKTVAEVITYVPSYNRTQKYKFWENLLLAMIIFVVVLFIWDVGIDVSLWAFGFYIYGVADRRVQYYVYLSTLFAFYSLLMIWFAFYNGNIPWLELLKYIIPFGIIVYLSAWLDSRLCPQPQVEKELYENSEGKKKYRLKYRFEE